MKEFLHICFLVLVSLSSFSYAQEQLVIEGIVIDAETRLPLPNVNVMIRGTVAGTTTDSGGVFHLQLLMEKQYVLVFTHVAYLKSTRNIIDEGRTRVMVPVALQPNAVELGEVVVTGKRTFVPTKTAEQTALFKISGDEFERLGEERMERAMRYLLPDIVKPLIDRLKNDANDFTLYVDGEWKESMELDDVDPFRIVRVFVWQGVGRKSAIDIFPIGLPLRRGRYVILIETK